MLPALLALLGFGIVVQRQVRHLFAGRALALFQHVKTGLHILTEFAELLGQPFHHRSAVLVRALGQMVGFGLCLVKNRARFLPCKLGDVLLAGQELCLFVGVP